MVPLLIAIITFTGLIFMRLDEQGRSITDIFSENTQAAPTAEPIIGKEQEPKEPEPEPEETEQKEEEVQEE